MVFSDMPTDHVNQPDIETHARRPKPLVPGAIEPMQFKAGVFRIHLQVKRCLFYQVLRLRIQLAQGASKGVCDYQPHCSVLVKQNLTLSIETFPILPAINLH